MLADVRPLRSEGRRISRDRKQRPPTLPIDTGPIPAAELVPSDATHLHFGDARTETEVSLSPGTHKLTAQFADGAHHSFGPAMSQTITVTVK